MISLVVPVLSEAVALRANLPRLLALEGDKEVVVADGGSSDDSVAVARTLGARVVESACGRGPQMNAGARAARGDVLVFVHADCWLDDGALHEVRALLARDDVLAGVFRQHIEADRRVYRWIERAADWRARYLRTPYGDSGLFVRRPVFEHLGGFPDVPLCEDLGLARRLRRARKQGVFAGRVALASACIHVSPRRWESHGVVRTTLLNWCVATSFRLGVPPGRLYRAYYGKPCRS